jgi:hypothetical protein
MAVNTTADSILRNAIGSKNKPTSKAVVVRFNLDLWAKAQKKLSRMIDEAADSGNTATISIHSVVIEALKDFVEQ